MIPTTSTPDPRSPRMIVDQPTPCYIPPGTKLLDPTAFDILIDHDRGQSPIWRHALREARNLCGFNPDGTPRPADEACPVRDTCLRANADEEWAQAIVKIEKRRPCESCSRLFTVPKNGPGKRFCSEACQVAARRAVTTLEDIPAGVRAMHAAFQRHTTKGEPIPVEVRSGERAYQTLKKRIARAAKKDAA